MRGQASVEGQKLCVRDGGKVSKHTCKIKKYIKVIWLPSKKNIFLYFLSKHVGGSYVL